MSNVTLNIGGRQYLVACAAGEENHVIQLGETIEAKVREIGAAGHNEVRLLLFAALLLADENFELKQKTAPAATPPATGIDPDALEALAARLEKCATAIEE